MNLDMTYCISHLCPLEDCKRYLSETEEWRMVKQNKLISFAAFEPHKGKDCEGYKPKEQQP